MNKKDIENLKVMQGRLQAKKKKGFWAKTRAGVESTLKESRERREYESKIRREAFTKARQSEIKRQAAKRGRASAQPMSVKLGNMFSPPPPPRTRTKRKGSKKKKRSSKKRSNNRGGFGFDPMDNWGLL